MFTSFQAILIAHLVMIVCMDLLLGGIKFILILTPYASERDTFLLFSFRCSRCTAPGLSHCNRDGLNMDMWGGFIAMHIDPDDVLCSPAFTSPSIGIQSPVSDSLSQPDFGVARFE